MNTSRALALALGFVAALSSSPARADMIAPRDPMMFRPLAPRVEPPTQNTQNTQNAVRPARVILFQQPANAVRPGQEANRAAWRAYLTAQRNANIQRLAAYANAGVFPVNASRPGLLRVMIDDRGTLCAVANLMALSGHRDMVNEASARDNNMRFITVTEGPIANWIQTSGFTREEIDSIQFPDSFQDRQASISIQERQRNVERARVRAHFNTLLPKLRADTSNTIEGILSQLGDLVMQAPPPVA